MAGVEQSGELLSAGYQGVVYKFAAGPEYPGTDYLIVKQPMGSILARWFRRRMIRREYRVYLRLAGIVGIPKCFGLENSDRLLLEFIEGHPLKLASGELEDRELFFAALLKLLQTSHLAGVAHADLKRKENILVTPAGLSYLIDFGSAVTCAEDGNFLRRWLFRQACQIDLNAWIKHKYLGQYDEVSAADAPYYQPTFIERTVRPLRRIWRKVTARQWRKRRRRSQS
jgi:predicted Ser/Thr protein kinase